MPFLRILSRFFATDAYVRIRRDQIHVRFTASGAETTVRAETPFSSRRLLVGDFVAAEQALKAALRQAGARGWRSAPRLLMHPLEQVEDGLSQVEERVLLELGWGAGASKVAVWLGPELSDAEVARRFDGRDAAAARGHRD